MNPPSVLVLATRPEVADPVHQQAAAAGVRVATEDAPPSGEAPALVLAEPDRLADVRHARFSRRGPLHVVAPSPVADGVYRRALQAGASSVIAVPDDLPRLASLLTDLDRPRQGRVVAVTGGSGGVGASTLAAAVALRVASRPDSPPTLLVDLDPAGPGLARLAGGTFPPGIGWADLVGLDGRLAAAELRDAVPRVGALGLLGWSDDPGGRGAALPVAEVLSAAVRGHDWVVIDVPRGAVDPVLEIDCDLVVVLVDGSVAGVASAARRLPALRAAGVPVAVMVRTRRGPAEVSDVARVLDADLLGEVREDRRLREHLDLGLGPLRGRRAVLGRAADRVIAAVPASEPAVRAR